MSLCFSFTIITSVETILKAATATIMSRMVNIIVFVVWMARKKLTCVPVQSLKPGLLNETRHVRRCRRPDNVARGADLLDGAGSHHRDAIGQSLCLEQVVRHEHARDRALLPNRHEHLLKVRPGDGVEGAERFIEEEHRGSGRERPRQRDTLTLSAGELSRVSTVEAAVREADEGHGLADQGVGVRYPDQPRHELDVPAHRPVRHETAFLHDVANVPPELHLIGPSDVCVVDGDRPAVGFHEAVEAPEQGGLA